MKDSSNQLVELIGAHGGVLVNRILPQAEISAALQKAESYPSIAVTEFQLADIEMIANGGFSPLQGFMNQKDYESVNKEMRLSDGTLWPLPITLSVSDSVKKTLKVGQPASFVFNKEIQGVIHVEDLFESFVGGKIDVFKTPPHVEFSKYNLSPRDARRIFKDHHWKTVVGFQTRNPIHRAHEYITKTALETVDGLFIHPVVGSTEADDVSAAIRMKCYEAVIENYYDKKRVVLGINPSNMLYAGPKEAVLHAIVRQNYGCTHFIVGRDHAGAGERYAPDEAQNLIKSFGRKDLAIVPLCFETAFWCKKLQGMATDKTTNSRPEERISLSGSAVRAMMKEGQRPPAEFTRPEVADILMGNIH